jgi:hypothetical protein
MALSSRREKDSKMAADLKKMGIYHGRRMTVTMAPSIPVNEPGSAAYRRLQNKKR